METADWVLVPIADCLIQASCAIATKAGMYECQGCIGNGKRFDTSQIHPVKVIIDASEKIQIVSVS